MSATPKGPYPTGLWAQFARHSSRYVVGLLLLAVYQYAQYWFATRMSEAINIAIDGARGPAIRLGLMLMGVALAAFVVRVMSRVTVFNAGRIAEYELRSELLERLLKLGPSFYRKMSIGEIMSRITNDLVQVRLLLGFGVLNVINTLFALIGMLAVMLPMSWELTLAALSPLPLLLLVTRGFSQQFYTKTRDNQDAIGRMSSRVQASIAGVRVVRSFGLEAHELEAFERTNRDYLDKSLSLARLRGSLGPILQAAIAAGILVVFWYGGHLMLDGRLNKGQFLSFVWSLGRLTWPLISLGFLLGLLQRGRAAYARLAEVYDAEPDIVSGKLLAPAQIEGKVAVRSLSFSYNGRQVLRDVTFDLEPGRSLAVVGRTGSGKSTLAVLLARLQPTPRSAVFLDGVDVCDLPLEAVRGVIGYAQQNAFLFSTTVGRNIGFPLDDPDAPDALARVRHAAEEACIGQEIRDLPDGYDTVVGERGVQLSGGQKQRVALAAAFVSSPKILILDDPLSAVDARTERGILEAIDRQRAERSLILITHRVAAAARCDRIIVLEQGAVVEQGTHAELVRLGGLYATFVEEQRIEQELEQLSAAEPAEVASA
jgi:ATP-binding cassette, subfamily B, multidrug efflux pump